ncbi:uncharacterized protein N7446_012002 [Penicillium canescens]|uniref:uncharacterized protein n=1 Tax=Penicillium canescens TaxID=5083 RepID=UPI0026E04353|nr:uncharacterized protein N7446_012002 [Penicillium canescens]KAJ6047168.1 hypothetical protein N7446_012002 [Penicillium canescens]
MGDTDDKGHVEEEIHKLRQDLQAMRDLRELVKLKAQLAEEQNKLQEEQARLDKAQNGVGPDAFGSISRQPSMASDFSAALDDFIRPFRDSSVVIATPTHSDQFENNNIATSGPTPVTCKRVRSVASPPALQEPYTPATDPASYAPEPVQINIGHIGQEPSAKRIRADEAAATLDLPRSTLRKLPLGEEGHKTGMRKFFSESGFGIERTRNASPSQPQTDPQPASLRTQLQATPPYRIPATPPNSAGLQVGIYQGTGWTEYIHYINTLDAHFAQHPGYYTEARKVELGAQYISRKLMGELPGQTNHPESMTWLSFCTLLAQELPRNARIGQTIGYIRGARQKRAQPVTHFALWLIQWAPFTPKYSARDFGEFLLEGALPEIRCQVEKFYTVPRDYNTLVSYLQGIENAIPARARVISSRKKDIVLNGDSQVVPVYFARDWEEYKQFISRLQSCFEQRRSSDEEALMIDVGRKRLSRLLREGWDKRAADLKEINWFAFCVFLVEQIPSKGSKKRYWGITQRENQPVDIFALELLRWAPDDLGAAHDRRKHLSERVLEELRSEAIQSLKVFDEFHLHLMPDAASIST